MENFEKLKSIIIDYLKRTSGSGCRIGSNNQQLFTHLETIEKSLQNVQCTDISSTIGNFIHKIFDHYMNNHNKFYLANYHYKILKELPENVIDFLNKKQDFSFLGCHGCIGFRCINTNADKTWFYNISVSVGSIQIRPNSSDIIEYATYTNIDENIYVFFTILNDKMYFQHGCPSIKSRELLDKISKLENE
jgi:hypothetical protein